MTGKFAYLKVEGENNWNLNLNHYEHDAKDVKQENDLEKFIIWCGRFLETLTPKLVSFIGICQWFECVQNAAEQLIEKTIAGDLEIQIPWFASLIFQIKFSSLFSILRIFYKTLSL
jgi:hypothetical protein